MAKVALLIVDVQHDFLPPSGSLAVADGEQVVPVICRLLEEERDRWQLVVASRDSHPAGHISFATSHAGQRPFDELDVTNAHGKTWKQTLWPEHCIRGTEGYKLHPDIESALEQRNVASLQTVIVEKGTDKEVEAYSAFEGLAESSHESLVEILRKAQVTKVVVVGLATDYCVRATALSAIQASFETVVLAAGARAVGGEEAAQKTYGEIRAAGGSVIEDTTWAAALKTWMQ